MLIWSVLDWFRNRRDNCAGTSLPSNEDSVIMPNILSSRFAETDLNGQWFKEIDFGFQGALYYLSKRMAEISGSQGENETFEVLDELYDCLEDIHSGLPDLVINLLDHQTRIVKIGQEGGNGGIRQQGRAG